jgi:general secretion pathway protein H
MSATGDGRDAAGAEAGFTLIEMLVVVGVMALVSGLIFPSFARTSQTLLLTRAEAGVAADLRAARAAALRSGRPVALTVAADGSDYTVGGQTRVLPGHMRLAARGPIAFFPDGSSFGGRIDLAEDGRGRVLLVDAVTGLTVVSGAHP